MATTRSAKGELVDFDLLKIKSQIASQTKPITVENREIFIDNKLKRQSGRKLQQILETETVVDLTAEVEVVEPKKGK